MDRRVKPGDDNSSQSNCDLVITELPMGRQIIFSHVDEIKLGTSAPSSGIVEVTTVVRADAR